MKMSWDVFTEEKMKMIASSANVLDVGGGIKLGKGLSAYEKLFSKTDYKTLDIDSAYDPDILGDIHQIPLPDASFEAVICKAVLEHVWDPGLAVREIYRILKPGGKCLVYVPFLYPYHAGHGYKDYYRFSRDGIRYLFRNFSSLEIEPVRGFWETWFYFLPYKLNKVFSPTLGRFLDQLKKQSGNQASGYNIFAVK